jgi:DNA-binding response OmpR family regulator
MNAAKILVVEDDTDLGRALALRLRIAGYQIVVAQDAYQAVSFTRRDKPSVIILDVCIPAGDGFRVHENLNEIPDFLTPIIYVSGGNVRENEARARKLGAAAYFPKPVDNDTLLNCIRQCLHMYPVVENQYVPS